MGIYLTSRNLLGWVLDDPSNLKETMIIFGRVIDIHSGKYDVINMYLIVLINIIFYSL